MFGRPRVKLAQFRMTNLLAKCAMLGIIAAGLSVTGDLGWLARRGMDVLEAADVAADWPVGDEAAQAPQPPAPLVPSTPAPAPHSAAAVPVPVTDVQPADSGPAREPPARPVTTATPLQPPANGPAAVSWASLAAGDRLVLWLGGQAPRCLVIDIVDPASGAAVAYEAAAVSREGRPLVAAGPPRRVVVGRPPERVPGASIEKGGLVHVADAGIAAVREGRWLGPIAAITVID